MITSVSPPKSLFQLASVVGRAIPAPSLSAIFALAVGIGVIYECWRHFAYSLDRQKFSMMTHVNLTDTEQKIIRTALLGLQKSPPRMEKDSTLFSFTLRKVIEEGSLDDLTPLISTYRRFPCVFIGNGQNETPILLALQLDKLDMAKVMLSARGLFAGIEQLEVDEMSKEACLNHLLKVAAKGDFTEVAPLIQMGIISPDAQLNGKPALLEIFHNADITRANELTKLLVQSGVKVDVCSSSADQSIFELGLRDDKKLDFLVSLLEEMYRLKAKGTLSQPNSLFLKNLMQGDLSSKESLLTLSVKRLIEASDAAIQPSHKVIALRKILSLLVQLSPEGSRTRQDGNKETAVELVKTHPSIASVLFGHDASYSPLDGHYSRRLLASAPTMLPNSLNSIISHKSELSGIPNASGSDCFLNSCMQVFDNDFYEYFDPEVNPVQESVVKANLGMSDTYRADLKSVFNLDTDAKIVGHLKTIQKEIFEFLRDQRATGTTLLPEDRVTKLRTLLHNNKFIEALPGRQEDTALVSGEVIHRLLLFTKRHKELVMVHTKHTFITEDMLPSRDTWEVVNDRATIDSFSDIVGNTLYRLNDEGAYESTITEEFLVNKIDVASKDLDYTQKPFTKNQYTEDLGALFTRYIHITGRTDSHRGKYYRIQVAKALHRHTLDVSGNLFTCHLKRNPVRGKAAAKTLLPVIFENKGNEFVLSSFSLHSGSSRSSGHYIAVRLLYSEERKLWEWNVFNDSITERLRSGAAAKLEDVTLPKGQGAFHDIGKFLAEKSTLLVYKKKDKFQNTAV